ncbi:dihydrofolate reductase, partial [Escherichia coli]|nr:dihydrofolate reductase [Escherichia coli]
MVSNDPDVIYFTSIESALSYLDNTTTHVFVSGGGEIYKALIEQADVIHLSVIHKHISGDVFFPAVPQSLQQTFEQSVRSNIDYKDQIGAKG